MTASAVLTVVDPVIDSTSVKAPVSPKSTVEFCSVEPPVPSALRTALSTLPVPVKPDAVLLIVIASVAASVVMLILVPATNVRVSLA